MDILVRQKEPKSLPLYTFPTLKLCRRCFCAAALSVHHCGGAYNAPQTPYLDLDTIHGAERREKRAEKEMKMGVKGSAEIPPPSWPAVSVSQALKSGYNATLTLSYDLLNTCEKLQRRYDELTTISILDNALC